MVIEAKNGSVGGAQVDCLPRKRLERSHNRWNSPPLPANPRIVLCESESHVNYLRRSGSLGADALIALTPQAACECKLLGLPYRSIEDFFDLTAFRDADEPTLTLQSRWSDMVDEFVWNIHPEFRRHEFRPAGHYFFFLKVMMDMLARATFGLAHLFVAAEPREVFYFAQEHCDRIPETLFFETAPYGRLLRECAAEYGLQLTSIECSPARETTLSASSLRQRMKNMLPEGLLAKYRSVRSDGVEQLFLRRQRPLDPATIVCAGGAEARLVMQYAETRGLNHRWVSDLIEPIGSERALPSELKDALVDSWKALFSQSFFAAPFQCCGVDLRAAAETRLQYWWHVAVPAMWRMQQQARACFTQSPPSAVFVSALWKPEEYAVLQAARSLNIPTITYQHGGFEGSCEYSLHDMTELRQSDYRLVYGCGNESYLLERAQRWREPRARGIAVGSARLDALLAGGDQGPGIRQKLQISPSAKVILLVPTSYQYNWYMARQSYYGVPYFDLLTKVVDVFKEFPDLLFLYKPFPEHPADPMKRIIQQGPDNCRVVTGSSVFDLVQASDACVIDIPSTGLLEAFLTDKPVLVFSDSRYVAMRPEARRVLSKRASLCETEDVYLRQLRTFLGSIQSDTGFREVKNANRDFLRMYGVHEDDGCSAERAVNALIDIIGKHSVANG